MERLETKRIKGKTYFYYSKWGWKDGKCRRLWQRYLGTSQAIIKMATEKALNRHALYAEVFQFGLPVALWNECRSNRVIERINECTKKRDRGLGTGTYLALAALNRAISPVSKEGMWEWFSKTSLVRFFPEIKEKNLSSQQFWNNMDKISHKDCSAIWEDLITGVIDTEKIDLSSVSYDGTNYYTFIDTFNAHCSTAKRGKNKQGRANLRQINYSLFCTSDGHIPLLYDVYEGNINDYTEFPKALNRFKDFFKKISNSEYIKEKMTVVFDKGNCSRANFGEIDSSEFYFVTSAKLDEHKELTSISNQDARFQVCSENLDRTKAFRIRKTVHGKERTIVVAYNDKLFECQWSTLQADIDKALAKLAELQRKLKDRENGLVSKGKNSTQLSIKRQCKEILSREHLKEIITCNVTMSPKNIPRLEFTINQDELETIADTYLGKNLIITNRDAWTNDRIILAYRSQYIIEDVFKESKDRKYGTWWPQYHWTDSKIYVHALYCTIALLLRATMKRRAEKAGIKISMKRLLTELSEIHEVVNIYKDNGKNYTETVLSKMTEIQESLATILGLTLKAETQS